MSDFLQMATAIRRQRPPFVAPAEPPPMLCDGLDWEAPRAGDGITADCFVRVAAHSGAISASWEFVGRVVERHAGGGWQVSLGCDYPHDFVVDGCYLHRIQADLNVLGVIEPYLMQRARQGFCISRRLGADSSPVEG